MKIQLFKFLIIGGLNTMFGYSVFAIFLYLNFHYTVAVLIATILGIVFNFFTIGRLVFANNKTHLIFRFISVYIVIYLLNILGLWIFERYKFDLYTGGALLILPLAFISFLLNKYLVFMPKKEYDEIN